MYFNWSSIVHHFSLYTVLHGSLNVAFDQVVTLLLQIILSFFDSGHFLDSSSFTSYSSLSSLPSNFEGSLNFLASSLLFNNCNLVFIPTEALNWLSLKATTDCTLKWTLSVTSLDLSAMYYLALLTLGKTSWLLSYFPDYSLALFLLLGS